MKFALIVAGIVMLVCLVLRWLSKVRCLHCDRPLHEAGEYDSQVCLACAGESHENRD